MADDAALAYVLNGLWGSDHGPDTDEHRAGGRTETYLAVPSLRRARFLVPASSRRAAAASLLAYNRLRPLPARTVRAGLGAGVRVAPGRLVRRNLVRVEDSTLVAALESALRRPDLHAGIGLHHPDPNYKPTLQLFDGRGRPVGYAKVGWTPSTAALVRAEALALGSVPNGLTYRRPGMLAQLDWRGRPITVVAPLPRAVRRYPAAQPPPSLATTVEVAGDVVEQPLASSPWWQACRSTLTDLQSQAAASGEDAHRLLSLAVARSMAALEARHGDRPVPMGRWHGDWVPWNLARERDVLHVFDWEHSGPSAPVGMDLAHWTFQCALVLAGKSAQEAAAAVMRAAETGPPITLGDVRLARLVARLYLLEMALRTFRLQRQGGGWNPALYPGLLPVLDTLDDGA